MYNCPFCNVSAFFNQAGFIAEFDHTIAVLNFDQRYKGRSLLIIKKHYEDYAAIPAEERHAIDDEKVIFARAVAKTLSPHKMNYEMLGNVVHHLHWHVTPRYHGDPGDGGPIVHQREPGRLPGDDDYRALAKAIRNNLA